MNMDLQDVTYQGPALDDEGLLDDLPDSLKTLLTSLNGFIQFGGGLHVRGACTGPDWHSLRRAWREPGSFHEIYPLVNPDWVPFAEDCVGDQFFLDGNAVLHLLAETGDVESMGVSLGEFLRSANADPVNFLAMEPLLRFRNDEGDLPTGSLLSVYPPFCTEESANGVWLKAVPAWELHKFHADLAKGLPPEGGKFGVQVED